MKASVLTFLSLAFIALVLYGSWMPFDFAVDAPAAGQRLERALNSWPTASRSDLWMNFLLYVPLGFLLATRWFLLGKHRLPAGMLAALAGLGLTLAVEIGQLFLPSRISQVHDLFSNAAGAMAGAVIGSTVGGRFWQGLSRYVWQRWDGRLSVLAAATMCTMLALDGLAPLMPVRSLSDLADNVRQSILSPVAGLAIHPWHRWLVCRIGVFAVLAVLLGAARSSPRRRWYWGAACSFGFAVLLEASKPFFYGRTANSANVVTAACGALAGLICAAALSSRLAGRRSLALAIVLLVSYAVYREWTPFTFAWEPVTAREKVPSGADWLPLSEIGLRNHDFEDALDFVRYLVLMGVLAYTLRQRRGWFARGPLAIQIAKAAGVTLLLGAVLEGGQFLLPGRSPGTSELLAFWVGGAAGAWLNAQVAKRQAAPSIYPPGGEKTYIRPRQSKRPVSAWAFMTRRRLATALAVLLLVPMIGIWFLPGSQDAPIGLQASAGSIAPGRFNSRDDPDTFKPFHFVHVGDPQIGFGEDGIGADTERFNRLVTDVNRLRPDFVFIAGDLTHDRDRNEVQAIEAAIRRFQVPVYIAPGNHDISNHGALEAYRQRRGPDYHVLTHKNCEFIFLNSVLLSDMSPWFKGRDERFLQEVDRQWSWLEETLANARSRSRTHIFLLMHVPPYMDNEDERAGYGNLPAQARKRLLGLMLEYNVRAVLCGHLHKNVQTGGYPPIYCAGGTARLKDAGDYGYRVFAVSKHNLAQQFRKTSEAAGPVAGTTKP